MMLEKKIRKKVLSNNIYSMIKSGCVSATLLVALSIMLSSEINVYIVIVNFFSGLFIGFMVPGVYLFSINIFMKYKTFKHIPYYLFILSHCLVLVVATFIIYIMVGYVLFREYVWLSSNIKIALSMSFFIAIFFTADTILKQFLGQGFVKDMLMGKYHEPKEKRIIAMFIDLANSTSIAENLSHREFYGMLNAFFTIVEQCSFLYYGKIYKYLGDGVIIVWDSVDDNFINTYEFMKEFELEVNRSQKYFNEKYGFQLDYTMGLHEGLVLVGELGDVKKELGYWGDTVNTVQRIQSLCKVYTVRSIASCAYYDKLKALVPKIDFEIEFVDNLELKGKENSVDVVCIKFNQLL